MKICNFSCSKDCSELCCGGATLVTIEEIRKYYEIFPITVGFRKYSAMSNDHMEFLNEIGFRYENCHIVGDFIAGNRYRDRCVSLDDKKLCSLHKKKKKPLQCRIVPFCAIYPEESQDAVFSEQRDSKFSKCKGYRADEDTAHTVWKDGTLTDKGCRAAFYSYQKGLKKQKPLMRAILESLKAQPCCDEFLKGDGILETYIPANVLFDVLKAAKVPLKEYHLFINHQGRLCYEELVTQKKENPVLKDYLESLNGIARSYAEFSRR